MDRIIAIIFLLSSLLNFSLAMASEEKIDKIIISGNKRIQTLTINDYIALHEGQQFSLEAKDEALKRLYATSFFEDISISFLNGILKVNVKENPFVNQVIFTGNSEIKSTTLIDDLLTTKDKPLEGVKIKADTDKIKKLYKNMGMFSVNVEPKIVKGQNDTVKVIFKITECPKLPIKSIYFIGNSNYSNSELKSIITTKESKWFSFFEGNHIYNPSKIEHDKYLLTKFYKSAGFADFNVISVIPNLLPEKKGFTLTYSIEEGDKYKFGDIKLDNKLKDIKTAEIQAELEKLVYKKKGKTFNLTLLELVVEKISNYLGNRGYPQVEVDPNLMLDKKSKIADVVINIHQSKKVFINKINIEGNLKTEDHVIRRELKIAESDLYNHSKLVKGEQNIRDLDYFDKVILKISPTKKKDRCDVNIKVQEKSTVSINLGVKHSDITGLLGNVLFSEKNFLGSGKSFSASLEFGKKNKYYSVEFLNPYFFDRDLSLNISLFKNKEASELEQNYTQDSIGKKTSVSYNITDKLSHEVEYSIKKEKLKLISDSASIFIKEQMGTFTTSAIGHNLTYKKLDSKNGYSITASQEIAGLGGNIKYLKHELDTEYLKSFLEDKYTLKLTAATGNIHGIGGQKVKIFNRFNRTLRGFTENGIGPRDKKTRGALNGQNYYTVSSELIFPLPRELSQKFNLSGAIFCDFGSLWDADSKYSKTEFYNHKTLRISSGFGFIWLNKLQPVKIYWGFPLKKQKYDERKSFQIEFNLNN